MHPVILIPLVSCVLAAMIAAAIISHDPGQRANRVIALVLVCSGWWSFCEVISNVQEDPEVVLWLIKLSCLGWMLLGPLSLDVYIEILGDARSRLRRLVPLAYASAAVSILLYLATPWCLTEAVRTTWGWGFHPGPLFLVVYGATMSWVLVALINWPRFFAGTPRERRQALWMFVGIAVTCAVASTTDVLLPYLDIQVPRLGSTSLLVMGCIVAWSVRRHGYFLLAPGAFTREILETLRDGVALLHPDGRIRTCNEGLARLVGNAAEQLRDAAIADFLPELSPAGDAEFSERGFALAQASGETIPVSVSSSLLRSAEGSPVGRVLAIRDLREVTALRGRLITSGRLAVVGELAAGIAQEIASPVTDVRSNLVQLRHHWQAFADAAEKASDALEFEALIGEGEELIEESVEGVDRVASIVRDVGAFSDAGRGRFQRVDLNEILDHAVGVAVLSFSVGVERCYAELPAVHCDPHQIKQVFLDLLLNAMQAVGDCGNIRLVTQARGGWAEVRVEDNGPGIPEDVIDRVFDPFFTTRPTGEGLGLGLAQCYQTLLRHGGEISVSSKPGLGASFEVRLPAAPAVETR
ncbi:MAG: PAS domain S-box protein [Deltaproteobacteria bacterium]|nr:PAS domain S-box protein [Deltaproteobacteria bacterium]